MTTPPSPPEVNDLEIKIRRALHARADAYTVTGVVRSDRGHPGLRRWAPRSAFAGAALVAVVIALVVAAAAMFWRDSSGQHESPAGVPSTEETPTTTEAPPIPGATNVPLGIVDTPASASMALPRGGAGGSGIPTSYRAGGGPPVTIAEVVEPSGTRSQCLSVESSYNSADPSGAGAGGNSNASTSTCGNPAGGVMQVFHYPHADSPADPIIFYAWTQVPPETAYVILQSADRLLWQRPINGVAVFPVSDSPIDATLRAVRADGSDTANASIAKSYNGAEYIPGQAAQHTASDPRYPMCQVLVGGDGLVGIFDHGTKTPVKITVEEFCDGQYGPIGGLLPYSDQELQSVGVTLQRVFTNGAFVPTYVEYEVTNSGGVPTGTTHADRPISPEEVVRRIEQARAANK